MPKITLILHNIRSTHNVGAIFRTAEGFGVKKIILSGYTPYPELPDDTRLPHIREKLTNQIHKTALGAEAMVPFEYIEDLERFLERELPPNLLALEQASNSIDLREFTPPAELTLLLGEEVHGIEQKYLNRCDTILEIPMHGQKESFNVSIATGIALYQLAD